MPGEPEIQQARQTVAGLLLPLYHDLLDLVFPPQCTGCNRVGFLWCPTCESRLNLVPIELEQRSAFDQLDIISTGKHKGILQQAVHGLKYENATDVVPALAGRLLETLRQVERKVEVIVPVPLHESRRKWRGYNQAEYLACELATSMAIPCLPDTVKRHRNTPTQVGLNQDERLVNVKDAFVAQSDLKGLHVLLVDDVATTGATLVACAGALRKAGAEATFALTVTSA